MILRNFLYLNEELLDGYLSAIEGFTPTRVTQTTKETNTQKAGISAKVHTIGGELGKNSSNEIETKMEVEISPSSKIQKLMNYLNEEAPIQFYEYIDVDSWKSINRDEVIEFMGTLKFSKIKELTNAVSELERLSNVFQNFSEQSILDSKTKKSFEEIKSLNNLQRGNEIPCVLSFGDSKEYKVVCYLNDGCFKTDQSNFVGEVTVFCKIQKKIEKGNSIQLTDIFKSFRELPLNREQRRSMPNKKQLETPKEFADVVYGPAFVVTPIAIYN